MAYTDFASYSSGSDLSAVERALSFDSDVSVANREVIGYADENLSAGDAQAITLVRQSASGTWFCLSQQNTTSGVDVAGVLQEQAVTLAEADSHAECTPTGGEPRIRRLHSMRPGIDA